MHADLDQGDRVFMVAACGFFVLATIVVSPVSFSFFSQTVSYEAIVEQTLPAVTLAFEQEPTAMHLDTPEPLKAIYMTSWVAGTPHIRTRVVDLIDTTEINAVVIDIKDDTGNISFLPRDSYLQEFGSGVDRIADIDEFLALLHKKGIYVIGRISVFQDPLLVKIKPEWAIKSSARATTWYDRRGLAWIDVGALGAWDYTIAVAREAYARGFDEINFDYVRFPSDGNTQDMVFPFSEGRSREVALEEFFSYLSYSLSDDGFPISADLFGLVTTQTDDMGIGQVLERALPYFDYIAPMVYPSHFGDGVYGIPKPALDPYQTVYRAMSVAVGRTITASTSPSKLRPWLQDFDLGAVYTPEMVRAQISATEDSGLTSWMLWDPSNRYTRVALHAN